jgi:hypothetical protein
MTACVAISCGSPQPATEAPAAPPAASGPAAAARPAEAGYAAVGEVPCDPVDDIRFVCGLVSPEDLAVLPGGEWLITSGNREGGRLHLVNVRERSATMQFPAGAAKERFDAAAYPTCPGPLALEKPDLFRAHGLYLKPGKGSVHTLLVVHHGVRESIEVFDVDAQAKPPSLTWVGCVPALSTMVMNGVVALPAGGYAATSGRTNDVWQYQTATGWRRIPGSEDTAPNGLEISRDGRWLYIAGWAEEKVTRISLGQAKVTRDVVQLGFRPDNVRFSADGSVLFAAGHTDKEGRSIKEPRDPLSESSNVARIDPKTLEARRVFQHRMMPGFVATTTGIQIGDELWLGSQRGDRIGYLPAPK